LIFMISALLTGCGAMNSSFSCDATAGDRCLTIEQVDAMTRFADDVKPKSSVVRGGMMKADNNHKVSGETIITSGQSLWVARHLQEKSWG